jgi:hypothetical protein
MNPYYGPKSPNFIDGPTVVIPYEAVLAPTCLHGPDIRATTVGIVDARYVLTTDTASIPSPTIPPDDTSTMEGKIIHYNRIRLIASSILFHHNFDGSFPKSARERVRFDYLTILNWPAEMVSFVTHPLQLTHEPLHYPPILEAAWLGDYPGEPYLHPDREYGDYIGPRKNENFEVLFGPPTYLQHLSDNWDFNYETLRRLLDHQYYYEIREDEQSIAWTERAIECWYKFKDILAKIH